jgi:crotonobetainyl-CoA:carnitine CoA-transferase CaiB-like acyl-CoA transferase
MKVVDLSEDVAGRFAAKLFAMAGATVVRPVAAETATRGFSEEMLARYVDAGKHLVEVGRADIAALLASADLVFSSFDRGRYVGAAVDFSDALGDGHAHVTTSTFGMTGPYAGWRGGPMAGWAGSGYPAITGESDREPLIGPETLCDYVAGYMAALAAEAAVLLQRRGGGGTHIDISTIETMLGLHQTTFSRMNVGDVRGRTGHLAEIYPLVVRPCADGNVSIGVVTNAEFDRFCIAIGRIDLVDDKRFSDPMSRLVHYRALDEAMDPFLLARTAAELVEHFQTHGVASAEVLDACEIVRNPQLLARHFIVRDGEGLMPGNPIGEAKRLARRVADNADEGVPQLPRGARPLEGMLVLDLTAYWAGPSATRMLADLGAEVIWIERPRSRLDYAGDGPMSVYQYLYQWKMGRHKQSVVLDLETEAGREAAWRIAMQADVLVENFRPGVADKLGVGPAALCDANPGLVYVSLSGFGADGPWRDRRSFGPNIEACSSVMARTGYVGDRPLRLGHALPDGVGGVAGALAAVRGLRQRQETGVGGWFDISQLETYAALSGEDILAASLLGAASERAGNRSHHGATQGVFACLGEDQWVALRLADDIDRRALAELTGIAELADPATDADRVEALITDYTKTREKGAVAAALQGAGIEAMPILTAAESVVDPHLLERGYFAPLEVNGASYVMPGSPIRSDPPIIDLNGTPPRFGAATAAVLNRFDCVRTAAAG